MIVAQQLYEGIALGGSETVGLITYMRTDSTTIAKEAQEKAREVITERFGAEFLPDKPPTFSRIARARRKRTKRFGLPISTAFPKKSRAISATSSSVCIASSGVALSLRR